MYNVNFRDILFQLIPHFLRKMKFVLLLYAIIKPLKTLNNTSTEIILFFGQANKSLYQFWLFINNFLKFNSQIIYLEHYLNDLYDPLDREIYIINSISSNFVYLFNAEEQNQHVYLFNASEGEAPTYLYNSLESASQYDFIVKVPNGIYYGVGFNKLQMRGRIDYYKIAGKKYVILPFTLI